MKVLVVGSGGREHAIVWKVRQSPLVSKIYCAPGNAGIGDWAELVPIESTNIDELLKFAEDTRIDLTIVGPEQPLVLGIVDRFESKGLSVFGPSTSAAALEGSKVFAKQFMRTYGIPTAEFRSFTLAQRYDAERYINELPPPIVVKADGLAAGKGVAICESKERAIEALDMLMGSKVFGSAGTNIVIEEYLEGEEASLFAICDGTDFVVLASAQDHKRILDNDQGKNTGGMGAYAPAPIVTASILESVKRTIIRPTLLGMQKEKRPYKGCLYVGLMITPTGPKVVEYNARFGDPETQVVLPLLENDFVELALASIQGSLRGFPIRQKNQSAVCVVLASGGYPDSYESGKQIFGLDTAEAVGEEITIFHSGTRKEKGHLLTSGGRVLGVTAVGPKEDLEATVDTAYRAVEKITFDGAYYRSDIGRKGVLRMKLQKAEHP